LAGCKDDGEAVAGLDRVVAGQAHGDDLAVLEPAVGDGIGAQELDPLDLDVERARGRVNRIAAAGHRLAQVLGPEADPDAPAGVVREWVAQGEVGAAEGDRPAVARRSRRRGGSWRASR
jgi:hypothetical protein